jgi:putative transposase
MVRSVALMVEKKVKGRKRHIMVDTQGHVLGVHVHAANRHDTKAAHVVMARALWKYPSITGICGVAGYRGTAVEVITTLTKCVMDIVEKLPSGWSILPKRWIVERTLAWLNTNRRLSKDYEIKPQNSENVIRIAAIRLILNKIC